jgi:hypothetical protein
MRLISPNRLRELIREAALQLRDEGFVPTEVVPLAESVSDPRVSRITEQELHRLVKEEFSRAILGSQVGLLKPSKSG